MIHLYLILALVFLQLTIVRDIEYFLMNYPVSVIQQKKVIITNNHGEKLMGSLHETGSAEIVILCHGFRSTKVGCFDI